MNNIDSKKIIFDFVFRLAVDDATNQQAYKGNKSKIEQSENIKKCILDYMDRMLSGTKIDIIDIANNVHDEINDPSFSFGNIQKLINMTAKYYYIMCVNDVSLRDKFSNFDCPMDKKMILNIRYCYKKLYKDNNWDKDLLLIPYGNGKEGIDGSKIAWSKIKFEETNRPDSYIVYKKYQSMVSLISKYYSIYPIECDYLFWPNNFFDKMNIQDIIFNYNNEI